jgi:hypothetical protein
LVARNHIGHRSAPACWLDGITRRCSSAVSSFGGDGAQVADFDQEQSPAVRGLQAADPVPRASVKAPFTCRTARIRTDSRDGPRSTETSTCPPVSGGELARHQLLAGAVLAEDQTFASVGAARSISE